MYKLLYLITSQFYHVIGYANDILVIVRGRYVDALFGVMQKALGIVDSCCKKIGFVSVNLSETDVVVFTKWYDCGTTSELKLGGQQREIKERAE